VLTPLTEHFNPRASSIQLSRGLISWTGLETEHYLSILRDHMRSALVLLRFALDHISRYPAHRLLVRSFHCKDAIDVVVQARQVAEQEYLAALSWYRDRSLIAATNLLETIAKASQPWPSLPSNSERTLRTLVRD
jgi:hypothetical protein